MAITGSITTNYNQIFSNSYAIVSEMNYDHFKEYTFFKIAIYKDIDSIEDYTSIENESGFTIFNKFYSLGQTYMWNGTTSVDAQSAPSDLIVGNFIKLNSSGLYFEVSAISGTTITILNPDSLTIPDTGVNYKKCSKAESITSLECFEYFGKLVLSGANMNPIYQCEEYLLDTVSRFSGFTRV